VGILAKYAILTARNRAEDPKLLYAMSKFLFMKKQPTPLDSSDNFLTPKITPCVQLTHPLFDKYKVQVWVKLDYLNHPEIQGNKLHKLKYNLLDAVERGAEQLITFGGAYSNHIAATAAAANEIGLPVTGVIRGQELEQHPEKWSHTLKHAQQNGMQFLFISRKNYRLKQQAPQVIQWLKQHPKSFVIPEGGSNDLAIKGFDEMCAQITQQMPDWTHLYCPVGTGGTLAGLIANCRHPKNIQISPAGQKRLPTVLKNIIGIAVLNEADYLRKDIQSWIETFENKRENKIENNNKIKIDWQLITDAAGGGYGKTSNYLKSFQKRFEQTFNLPLDPIYTAKLFHGIYKQIVQKKLPAGSKVLVLHTGGLQGNEK